MYYTNFHGQFILFSDIYFYIYLYTNVVCSIKNNFLINKTLLWWCVARKHWRSGRRQSRRRSVRFAISRHRCLKSCCVIQMYIWYLFSFFKIKMSYMISFFIYNINNVVCLFLFIFKNKLKLVIKMHALCCLELVIKI